MALTGLASIGCGARPATTQPTTSNPTNCANVGCAAPPLCSDGCRATCGCCSCRAGERAGDLLCTDRGCYVPDAAPDAGPIGDAGPVGDAGSGSDAGWSPAPACALPFDTGPCEAAIPVFAFVGGSCVARTYGGCQGNDNRFRTLEECMAICEGRPVPLGCPMGRTAQRTCLECAPNDACLKSAEVCTLTCDQTAAANTCPATYPTCLGGVCRAVPCG